MVKETAKLGFISVLAVALCLEVTSCNRSSAPSTAQEQAPGQQQAPAQYPGSDPAQANLASANQQSAEPVQHAGGSAQPQASYPPPPQSSYQAAPAPAPQNYDQGYDAYNNADDTAYGEQPVEAEQPPPPLLEYNQPACPGDNYLWTPGYWGYASAGYYWVPGAWVVAPFVGALWTPPYWGFGVGRYRWHHGYWGSHVGFYGGVNYGYGYVGRGYEGGYWNRGNFEYNRSVNNVNTSVVRNVYNYRVNNYTTNTRVSYNGGHGGLNVRPTAAETAVLHEQRIAPVPAQVQSVRQASANRAQFADVNHGRPAMLAAARPLETGYRAPATHPAAVPGARVLAPMNVRQQAGTAPQNGAPVETRARPGERGTPAAEPNANRPANETRANPLARAPEPNANRPALESRPAPATQPRVEARPTPQPQPRFEQRPTPQAQPRVEQRPAPQAQPRSAPQVQPHVEQRPAPAEPRVEQRPAPEPRAEQRPTPQAQPQAHEEPRRQVHQEPPPAAKPATKPAPAKSDDHPHE